MLDPVYWTADASVSLCGACRRAFSIVLRRHHCRHCGGIFCSDCSEGRLWLRPFPSHRPRQSSGEREPASNRSVARTTSSDVDSCHGGKEKARALVAFLPTDAAVGEGDGGVSESSQHADSSPTLSIPDGMYASHGRREQNNLHVDVEGSNMSDLVVLDTQREKRTIAKARHTVAAAAAATGTRPPQPQQQRTAEDEHQTSFLLDSVNNAEDEARAEHSDSFVCSSFSPDVSVLAAAVAAVPREEHGEDGPPTVAFARPPRSASSSNVGGLIARTRHEQASRNEEVAQWGKISYRMRLSCEGLYWYWCRVCKHCFHELSAAIDRATVGDDVSHAKGNADGDPPTQPWRSLAMGVNGKPTSTGGGADASDALGAILTVARRTIPVEPPLSADTSLLWPPPPTHDTHSGDDHPQRGMRDVGGSATASPLSHSVPPRSQSSPLHSTGEGSVAHSRSSVSFAGGTPREGNVRRSSGGLNLSQSLSMGWQALKAQVCMGTASNEEGRRPTTAEPMPATGTGGPLRKASEHSVGVTHMTSTSSLNLSASQTFSPVSCAQYPPQLSAVPRPVAARLTVRSMAALQRLALLSRKERRVCIILVDERGYFIPHEDLNMDLNSLTGRDGTTTGGGGASPMGLFLGPFLPTCWYRTAMSEATQRMRDSFTLAALCDELDSSTASRRRGTPVPSPALRPAVRAEPSAPALALSSPTAAAAAAGTRRRVAQSAVAAALPNTLRVTDGRGNVEELVMPPPGPMRRVMDLRLPIALATGSNSNNSKPSTAARTTPPALPSFLGGISRVPSVPPLEHNPQQQQQQQQPARRTTPALSPALSPLRLPPQSAASTASAAVGSATSTARAAGTPATAVFAHTASNSTCGSSSKPSSPAMHATAPPLPVTAATSSASPSTAAAGTSTSTSSSSGGSGGGTATTAPHTASPPRSSVAEAAALPHRHSTSTAWAAPAASPDTSVLRIATQLVGVSVDAQAAVGTAATDVSELPPSARASAGSARLPGLRSALAGSTAASPTSGGNCGGGGLLTEPSIFSLTSMSAAGAGAGAAVDMHDPLVTAMATAPSIGSVGATVNQFVAATAVNRALTALGAQLPSVSVGVDAYLVVVLRQTTNAPHAPCAPHPPQQQPCGNDSSADSPMLPPSSPEGRLNTTLNSRGGGGGGGGGGDVAGTCVPSLASDAPFTSYHLSRLFQLIAGCGGAVPPVTILDVCHAADLADAAGSASARARTNIAGESPSEKTSPLSLRMSPLTRSPLVRARHVVRQAMRTLRGAADAMKVNYVQGYYRESTTTTTAATEHGSGVGSGEAIDDGFSLDDLQQQAISGSVSFRACDAPCPQPQAPLLQAALEVTLSSILKKDYSSSYHHA